MTMASIHMFFPMTSGDLDDDNPIPTLENFGRVVNHTPRPFTLGSISSALLDLLPCACVSAPHTDTQYDLGDGSPNIHDLTSILPLPPRRSTNLRTELNYAAILYVPSYAHSYDHRPSASASDRVLRP